MLTLSYVNYRRIRMTLRYNQLKFIQVVAQSQNRSAQSLKRLLEWEGSVPSSRVELGLMQKINHSSNLFVTTAMLFGFFCLTKLDNFLQRKLNCGSRAYAIISYHYGALFSRIWLRIVSYPSHSLIIWDGS